MNNTARVSDATRQKVLSAVAELNYRPNSIAQSLASKRSNSIGIILPELHGPFFGTLVSGIEQVLRSAGKHTIVTVGHSDEDKEKDGIEFLISRKCDAMVLHVDAVSDEYLETLSKGPVPVVIANRQVSGIAANCIALDNRKGGEIATRCLLERGHREIAYIAGPAWKTDAKERYAGHRAALQAFDISINELLVFEGDFQESSGSAGMDHLLGLGRPFTAVVCANDSMAAGAMRTARERGLDVPGDISIIGFDNVNFSHYLFPGLSTIDYPTHDIGGMAGRWVLRHVYGNDRLEIRNLFEPTLVLRESVRQNAG